MEVQPAVALIVARPGPLRNSLFSLINTLPQIEIVAECRDMPSLLRMGSKIQPDLLLMESDLPGNHVRESMKQVNREWPATRTVLLVDNVAQQQEAESAGADVVLFKGHRAAGLLGIIADLLSQELSLQQQNSAKQHPIPKQSAISSTGE